MKKIVLPLLFYIIVFGVILAFFQAYNTIKFRALEKALNENNNSQNTFLNDRPIYMSGMQDITTIKKDVRDIKNDLINQNAMIKDTIEKTINDKFNQGFNCITIE